MVDDSRNFSDEALQQLIDEGWQSTSNKFRILARLPEGMTGKQALVLLEEYPGQHAYLKSLSEPSAADHFRRCMHKEEHRERWQMELCQADYKRFRKLGGESSHGGIDGAELENWKLQEQVKSLRQAVDDLHILLDHAELEVYAVKFNAEVTHVPLDSNEPWMQSKEGIEHGVYQFTVPKGALLLKKLYVEGTGWGHFQINAIESARPGQPFKNLLDRPLRNKSRVPDIDLWAGETVRVEYEAHREYPVLVRLMGVTDKTPGVGPEHSQPDSMQRRRQA